MSEEKIEKVKKEKKVATRKDRYKLTDVCIEEEGIKLYQIEAMKDFADVKAGDKGGYIEKTDNLSQSRTSWVYDTSKVYGNAKVRGYAKIMGDSTVCGDTLISSKIVVDGNKKITSNKDKKTL